MSECDPCKTAKFTWWCRDIPARPRTFPTLAIFLSYHSSLPLIQLTATRVRTGESVQGKTTLRDIKASVYFSKAFRVSYLMLSTPLMALMNLKMHISLQHSLPVALFRMQMQFNTIRQDRKPRPFYRINCIPVAGQDKRDTSSTGRLDKSTLPPPDGIQISTGICKEEQHFPKRHRALLQFYM